MVDSGGGGTNGCLDARASLDGLRVGRLHVLTIALLFLCLVVDGIDQQMVSYLSPAIAAELHLLPAQVGVLFSLGLIGTVLGALVAGTLGDIVGPKRTIVVATLGVGIATCAMAQANTLWQLGALRIATGFGIGGSLPNILALAAQLAPARRRAGILTVMVAGFPAGATTAGLITAALFSHPSWRAAFAVAGLFPLVLAPLLGGLLPESIPVLLTRPNGQVHARRALQRLGAALLPDAVVVWPETVANARAPLISIFREGRARTSLTLTGLFILCLINVYFLSNWLPILMQRSGIAQRGALGLTTVFNLGGIAGVLVLGRLIDRSGVRRVLTGALLCASVGLVILALGRLGTSALVPLVFAVGMVVLGTQGVVNALPALLYPATLRATAGGWAIGTGRAGSVVGPLLGGALLSAGWSVRDTLLASAVVPLIAVALVATLNARGPRLTPGAH